VWSADQEAGRRQLYRCELHDGGHESRTIRYLEASWKDRDQDCGVPSGVGSNRTGGFSGLAGFPIEQKIFGAIHNVNADRDTTADTNKLVG
jgi:hypothetical protein